MKAIVPTTRDNGPGVRLHGRVWWTTFASDGRADDLVDGTHHAGTFPDRGGHALG